MTETAVCTDVFVVDDQRPFIDAAIAVLNASDDFRFVGCAVDRASALSLLIEQGTAADLVLMDISLGDDDGVALTSEILAGRPELSVVLVSTISEADLGDLGELGGALGYIPKSRLTAESLNPWRTAV